MNTLGSAAWWVVEICLRRAVYATQARLAVHLTALNHIHESARTPEVLALKRSLEMRLRAGWDSWEAMCSVSSPIDANPQSIP